jgi:hypothetical protein
MAQPSSRVTVEKMKKFSNEWTLLHGQAEGDDDCEKLVFAFWSSDKQEWSKHQQVKEVEAVTNHNGQIYLKV